eukprot:SAG22_NODE_2584_length_2416_cov_1.294346_1_plen_357_part_00
MMAEGSEPLAKADTEQERAPSGTAPDVARDQRLGGEPSDAGETDGGEEEEAASAAAAEEEEEGQVEDTDEVLDDEDEEDEDEEDEDAKWSPQADAHAEQGLGPLVQPERDLSQVTAHVAAHFTGEFCVARSFEPGFVAELLYQGFLPMAERLDRLGGRGGGHILLPKLHRRRSILEWGALRVSRSTRKAARRQPYHLTVDKALDWVVAGCHRQHGENWLYPPVVAAFKAIAAGAGAGLAGAPPPELGPAISSSLPFRQVEPGLLCGLVQLWRICGGYVPLGKVPLQQGAGRQPRAGGHADEGLGQAERCAQKLGISESRVCTLVYTTVVRTSSDLPDLGLAASSAIWAIWASTEVE